MHKRFYVLCCACIVMIMASFSAAWVIRGLSANEQLYAAQLASSQAEAASIETAWAETKAQLHTTSTDLFYAKDALRGAESNVSRLTAESVRLSADLATVQYNLSQLAAQLASSQAEAASIETAWAETKAQLHTTSTDLNEAKRALGAMEYDLNSSRVRLDDVLDAYNKALFTLAGLGIIVGDTKKVRDEAYTRSGVVLVDNPKAANPTFSQLADFLAQDETDKHNYVEDVYDCSEFALDLHNNAEAAGLKTGLVQLDLQSQVDYALRSRWYSPVGHALVAFRTTDYGLVYVDASNGVGVDTVVLVEKGKSFAAVDVVGFNPDDYRNANFWSSLKNDYYYLMPVMVVFPSWSTDGADSRGDKVAGVYIYW